MKAEASKVTVAVATVVIFGTVAIFLYPAIYPLMSQWFSPETFGIYIGSTVHEVAQVVAAGHAVGPGCGRQDSYFQNAARDDAGSVPHPAGGAC